MLKTKQLIIDVKHLVENNYNNPDFNVGQMCLRTKVSRASMYRKIMSQCNCSPQELIEDIRFKIAKRKIENDDCLIKELAYEVGFADPKYFSKRFKLKYCLTPTEYKKTYQKNKNITTTLIGI